MSLIFKRIKKAGPVFLKPCISLLLRPTYMLAITLVPAFLSYPAHAAFVVDYQGLDKEKARHAIARTKVAPEGFKVLTDKSMSIVHEFGQGKATAVTSFGDMLPLSDGMSMILPSGWVAFVDEDLSIPQSISWDASDTPWTSALRDIGVNSGLRFLVDWDQRVVQVYGQRSFSEPSLGDAVEVTDPKTGKLYLIYPSNKKISSGTLIHKDKSYPIKIVE